jgi:putative CRISPR-associated protein (TIGR02619 family)
MSRTILTTVGTSLLTNGDRPWAGWRHKQPLPTTDLVEKWLRQAELVKASAETHTWYRLGLFDADDRNNIEVVLIHSQTDDGRFCAERLVSLAQHKGLNARSRQVDGLAYLDGPKFNRGLRQLARVVGEEIKRGQASGTVELAATGGFKAEIAITNLVGAVSDTPVHYIYEQFTSLITIEPIPVTLRADWISRGAGRKLLEAFESANDVVPLSDIESLLKQDERLLSLLEIDEEYAALNLLGEIAVRLIATPHESWPNPTDKAPDDKIQLSNAPHHRPQGWERVVNTLAKSRYVTAIRYEGTAAGGSLREAPDNKSDLIHHIEGTPPLTIRISTTATTSGQRRLVQQLLRKELDI